jgi:hypothetical protein
MGQRWFEYGNITAAMKIHTAVGRSLNISQKTTDPYILFLKINTVA